MTTITLLLSIFFFASGRYRAGYGIVQPRANDLYQVFNGFVYEGGDAGRMSSNIELLNSDYFLPDGEDSNFGNVGDTLHIDLTMSNVGWGSARMTYELGYMNGDTYHTLIDGQRLRYGYIDKHCKQYMQSYKENIQNERYYDPFKRHEETFTISEEWMFAVTVMMDGDPLQR